MGGKCSTNEGNKKKYMTVVAIPEEKKIIIKSDKSRDLGNIKMDVNISTGSGQGPMIRRRMLSYGKKLRVTKKNKKRNEFLAR